jgi:uncharacterized protein YgbK (DUF1537 family)
MTIFGTGEAGADLVLAAGGSGAATGIAAAFRHADCCPRANVRASADVGGMGAVVSGSCSVATLAQVAAMSLSHPAYAIDPMKLAADAAQAIADAIAWARPRLAHGPVLIHAGQQPDRVAQVQHAIGRHASGAMIEKALAAIGRELTTLGVRRLVVAGGETSGAVVEALGVRALRIGPRIAPGVPATLSIEGPGLALALKSGNFGAEDFFLRALEALK